MKKVIILPTKKPKKIDKILFIKLNRKPKKADKKHFYVDDTLPVKRVRKLVDNKRSIKNYKKYLESVGVNWANTYFVEENNKKILKIKRIKKRIVLPMKFVLGEHAVAKVYKNYILNHITIDINDYFNPALNLLQKMSLPLKMNIGIIANYKKPDDEIIERHLSTKTNTILSNNQINDELKKQFARLMEMINGVASIPLVNLSKMNINIARIKPVIGGKSYMEKPKSLSNLRNVINIKNENDEKCFMWCILAALHPVEKDKDRITKYNRFVNDYDWDMFNFPVKYTDKSIKVFEEIYNVAIIIYQADDTDIILARKSTQPMSEDIKRIYLVFSKNEHNNTHYFLCTSLNALNRTKMKNNTDRCFVCENCLYSFSTFNTLERHHKLCINNDFCEVKFPKEGEVIKFKNHWHSEMIPFVIYWDTESYLSKESNLPEGKTKIISKHKTSGLFAHVHCIIDDSLSYSSPIFNDVGKFMEWLLIQQDSIRTNYYKNYEKLFMTKDDWKDYKTNNTCRFCLEKINSKLDYKDEYSKVRDHCHITGKYRGPAHKNCNLKHGTPDFIPVIAHNSKGYDTHFLMNHIDDKMIELIKYYSKRNCEIEDELKCIAISSEKYISFSLPGLRFIDSFSFMADSLERLINNNKPEIFTSMKAFAGENFDLLRRKGVYPYEFMDGEDKMIVNPLDLNQNDFYSKLRGEGISDEDYKYFKHVVNTLNIKTMREYHDLYLQTDVYQLCDVFTQFRRVMMKNYKLDPGYYYTVPGFGWDALLKYTEIELEYLRDPDMVMLFENIRGGIVNVFQKHQTFDDNNHGLYIDANNLYGHAMVQCLPYGNFQWNSSEWTSDSVLSLPDNGDIGYLFEVDIDYPKELHDKHNGYPLLPEKMKIQETQLSPFQVELYKSLNKDKYNSQCKKLVLSLNDKKNYVIDYRMLKFALSQGLILNKVHRVISYDQKPWMAPYILFNTNLRQKSENKFEKDLFKLMNNAPYGKTMENIRERTNFKLVIDEERALMLNSKVTFKSQHIFNENFSGVNQTRRSFTYNKPVYVGFCVVELSKIHMYNFFYNILKPKFDNRVSLMYTDTDSFILNIKSENLVKELGEFKDYFDFSNYNKNHPLYDVSNMAVLGKFKDELAGKKMKEFIALQSKVYNIITEDDVEKKVLKGVGRTAVKNLDSNDYKACLFNQETRGVEQLGFISKKHQVYTVSTTKRALQSFDDKRYWFSENSSNAHGHYKNI